MSRVSRVLGVNARCQATVGGVGTIGLGSQCLTIYLGLAIYLLWDLGQINYFEPPSRHLQNGDDTSSRFTESLGDQEINTNNV